MRIRNIVLPTREEKLWSVGDHRVKKVSEKKKVRESYIEWHGGKGYDTKKVPVTRYLCVDCEKKFGSREEFKQEECYEVIENGT